MENRKISSIECDGFHIAATVETDALEEQPIYYPANCIVFVERGELSLHIEEKVYVIKENQFGLVRKYTHGTYKKSWQLNQSGFKDHVFVLHDTFIREVIRGFKLPKDYLPCTLPMINLTGTTILKGLMKSIEVYITGQVRIDRDLIRLKTKEALYALTQQRPELIHIFNEFSESSKANLVNFVEHNYTRNLSLTQFAEMSGRSLSTFNREFRKEYKLSPHKWIKQKRLELAKKLLTHTQKTASDIYYEVGFEDLAHFSKSFKSYFGHNPSEIKSIAGNF